MQPPQSGALASCGVEAAAVKLDTAKSSGTEWSKPRIVPRGHAPRIDSGGTPPQDYPDKMNFRVFLQMPIVREIILCYNDGKTRKRERITWKKQLQRFQPLTVSAVSV